MSMTVYVAKVVFSEMALDEEIIRLTNDGMKCVVFRDRDPTKKYFGLIPCHKEQMGTVLKSYCDNNPEADRKKCKRLVKQCVAGNGTSITLVHNGIIFCNANVDAIHQSPE